MSFVRRHVGNLHSGDAVKQMLDTIKVRSIAELVKKSGVINNHIHKTTLDSYSEEQSLRTLKGIIDKNKDTSCFLGMGYYDVSTPSTIKRNILQNPQWYTAYTPYQAEISQGRLESQYNFQELIKDLTGLPIANASLLDEASATGEAISLSYAYHRKKRDTVLVSDTLHPTTKEVLQTRANNLGINLNILDLNNVPVSSIDWERVANIIFQYPDTYGDIIIPDDYLEWTKRSDNNSKSNNKILTTGICDLLSLTKLKTPGELGLDIAVGSSQRFGMPMWFGGPHPAFFATTQDLIRFMPGRIIGKTKDSAGNAAFRLSLQTREQHIKRQSATSNICTSQSLLTNVAAFYAIYNGPSGIKKISKDVNNKAKYFLDKLDNLDIINKQFYDTITLRFKDANLVKLFLEKFDILVRQSDEDKITISFSENTRYGDIDELSEFLNNFRHLTGDNLKKYNYKDLQLKNELRRKTSFMQDSIYSKYQTETELERYMYKLVKKDYSLCNGMIPLGSCTMKLNASYQLEPLLWDKICNIHPYSPKYLTQGFNQLIKDTGNMLTNLTGFSHISFQPNSGATGEYAGLITIKKHNQLYGDPQRRKCLIPKSSHGTNTASATIAGLDIIAFDDKILNDTDKFSKFVEKYKNDLLAIMLTYPNTNGVFRDNIKETNQIIHDNGGYVYMDGANLNALLGISDCSKLGFDICHLNLHKTFCIPHGGGGPGLGPILCNDKLANHLPSNKIYMNTNTEESCGTVAAAPYSSASLITIPYLYISAMGTAGLIKATEMALLNSNYLKHVLQNYYTIIDENKYGFVGHEFIIDVNEFKKYGINDNDIAKRLIDYNFHPPTMSWPRTGVLMFEPTESESKEELDRLTEAMISIRKEIDECINLYENNLDINSSILKNAPHALDQIINWNKEYTIEKAFFPVPSLKENKHFPSKSRVDDLYGDKLLLSKKN